jgi:hypothetical protein
MIDLNGAQQYIHWHFVTITWANAIVIALMVLVFVAVLFLPYPGSAHLVPDEPGKEDGTDNEGTS